MIARNGAEVSTPRIRVTVQYACADHSVTQSSVEPLTLAAFYYYYFFKD